MEHQRNQQPSPVPEPLAEELMEEQEMRSNLFASQRAALKERLKLLRSSKRLHPSRQAAPQELGEFPPLEAVPPPCQDQPE